MKLNYVTMITIQIIFWIGTGFALYASYIIGIQDINAGVLFLLASIVMLYFTIKSTILLYKIIKNGW